MKNICASVSIKYFLIKYLELWLNGTCFVRRLLEPKSLKIPKPRSGGAKFSWEVGYLLHEGCYIYQSVLCSQIPPMMSGRNSPAVMRVTCSWKTHTTRGVGCCCHPCASLMRLTQHFWTTSFQRRYYLLFYFQHMVQSCPCSCFVSQVRQTNYRNRPWGKEYFFLWVWPHFFGLEVVHHCMT